MKGVRIFKLLIIPLFLFIMFSCNLFQITTTTSSDTTTTTSQTTTTKNEATYKFNTTIEIPVDSELNIQSFLNLILNDPDHQLDLTKISFELNQVKLNELGEYEVTVSYVDLTGETKTVTITVKVIDNQKPVIIDLLEEYTIQLNGSLDDIINSITVTDNYDGELTLTADNFDFSQVKLDTAGTYQATLIVKDSSNNQVTVNFKVIVVDLTELVYQMNFQEELICFRNKTCDLTTFIQSITDNKNNTYQIGENVKVQTEGTVDTTKAGKYTVTYKLFINNNEEDTATVEIEVVDEYRVVFKESLIHGYNELFNINNYIEAIYNYKNEQVANLTVKVNNNLDITQIGKQTIEYVLFDGETEVFEDSIQIDVQYLYDFVDVDKICYVGFTCNILEFVKVVDSKGNVVNLEENDLSITFEVLDEQLDKRVIEYSLVKNDRPVRKVTKTIEFGYYYHIEFPDIIQVLYNSEFNINDYVLKIVDYQGNEETGFNVIATDVDTGVFESQIIEVRLVKNDITYYITTVTVEIVEEISDYDIIFVDDLTIRLSILNNVLDLRNLVVKVVDRFGREISLGDEYQLSIVSNNYLQYFGYNEVTYNLLYQDNIVYSETVEIFLTRENYQITHKLMYFYEVNTLPYNFNLLELLQVYDENGEEIQLDETFNYYTDSYFNGSLPGFYYIYLEVYNDLLYLGEYEFLIIVYDTAYTIEIDNPYVVTYEKFLSKTLDDIIVKDENGIELTITKYIYEPYYPFGTFILSNGYELLVYPLTDDYDNDPTTLDILVIVSDENYVAASKIVNAKLTSSYKIIYHDLHFPTNKTEFQVNDIVNKVTKDGQELEIGSDIIVKINPRIENYRPGTYFVEVFIKDMADNIVYSELVPVTTYEAGYEVIWKNTTIKQGEYTSETFNIKDFISNIYYLGPNGFVEIPVDEFTIEYEDQINFDIPHNYYVTVVFLKDDEIVFESKVNIKVINDFTFHFISPFVIVDQFAEVDPYDFLLGIYQNGERIDNKPGYEVLVSPEIVDTDEVNINYFIYKLMHEGKLVAQDNLYVYVKPQMILRVNHYRYVYLNDPDFSLDMLVEGVYDQNNNRLTEGYFIDFDEFDKTLPGKYEVDIYLYDDNEQLISVTKHVIYVVSKYTLDIKKTIDISDNISDISEVVEVYNTATREKLSVNTDYIIEYVGNINFSRPGEYDIYLIIRDLDGNLLSTFEGTIRVTDKNYIKPEYIDIIVENDGIIIIDKSVTELNPADYVIALYDDKGNQLDPDYYILRCYCDDIEFGTSGKYYLKFFIAYVGMPDDYLDWVTVTLYITGDYTAELNDNLSIDINNYYNFTYFDLIKEVRNAAGEIIQPDEYEVYLQGSIERLLGTYNVVLVIIDRYTGNYLTALPATIEITQIATIEFEEDLVVPLDGNLEDVKNLVKDVKINGESVSDYYIYIDNYVDTSVSGKVDVVFEIQDVYYRIIARQKVTIHVGTYFIDIKYYYRVIVGTDFSVDSLEAVVYDYQGNVVDIASLGYTLIIETPYDTSAPHIELLTIQLLDETEQVVANAFATLEVVNHFYVDMLDMIYIQDRYSSPLILINFIYDNVKNESYTISDLIIQVEGYYDFNKSGLYQLTFHLYTKNQEYIGSFEKTIVVLDRDYQIPDGIHVKVADEGYIVIDNTVTSIDFNEHIIGIFDGNGNEIASDLYKLEFRDSYINYGQPGIYSVMVNLYYYGEPVNPLDEIWFWIFITDGSTIEMSDDLTIDINDFYYKNTAGLIKSVIAPNGDELPLSELTVLIDYKYPIKIGTQKVVIYVRNYYYDIITAKIIDLDITQAGTITFIDDLTIDLFDEDIDLTQFIDEVKLNGIPFNDYQVILEYCINFNISGSYEITYQVFNLNGEIIALEQIDVFVGEYYIKLNPVYWINYGLPFTIDDLNAQVYDKDGNIVDLTELGLVLEFETPVDIYGDYYQSVGIIIRDGSKIVARNTTEFNVLKLYDVSIDQYVILGSNVDPIDLVRYVYDYRTGRYLEKYDYILSVSGEYDFNTEGVYYLIYAFSDLNGKLLFTYKVPIIVIPEDFEIPYQIYVKFKFFNHIIIDNTITKINFQDHINEIRDQYYNILNPDYFMFVIDWSDLEYGVPGEYSALIFGYFIGEPYNIIYSKHVKIIVTEGYEAIAASNLTFTMPEFTGSEYKNVIVELKYNDTIIPQEAYYITYTPLDKGWVEVGHNTVLFLVYDTSYSNILAALVLDVEIIHVD